MRIRSKWVWVDWRKERRHEAKQEAIVFLVISKGSLHFLSLLPLKQTNKQNMSSNVIVCSSSYKSIRGSSADQRYNKVALYIASPPRLYLLPSFLTFIILAIEHKKVFVLALLWLATRFTFLSCETIGSTHVIYRRTKAQCQIARKKRESILRMRPWRILLECRARWISPSHLPLSDLKWLTGFCLKDRYLGRAEPRQPAQSSRPPQICKHWGVWVIFIVIWCTPSPFPPCLTSVLTVSR